MTNVSSNSQPSGSDGRRRPAAGLFIDSVRVSGFRGLIDVTVHLEERTTYLVGENNAGKSSILTAIAIACGRRRATIDDLHIDADGQRAKEAFVDLIIRSASDEFPDAVTQRLGAYANAGPGIGEWTGIRTKLSRVSGSQLLAVSRSFLQWNAAHNNWISLESTVREQVLDLLAAQFVEASRDLLSDFARQTSDWGRVLMDLELASDVNDEIEGKLSDVAHLLQDSSPVLDGLQKRLRSLQNALAGVDGIEVRALPSNLEDLTRSVDVLVSSAGRRGLPLRYQGLGSRSLASLMVFHTLCELRVGVDRGTQPHIVVLLEEPEAHLHPQAQVAVRRLLEDLPGQAIVTTHSNVLLAEAPLHALRLLRPRGSDVAVHRLNKDTAKKIAVFRRYISRPLGELFFARLVILVDGTAERTTIPVLLQAHLGRDPAGLGVTIVAMEGMEAGQNKKVIDALAELGGIPWLFFVDSDDAGRRSIDGLVGTDGKPLNEYHDQVIMSGNQQLERMLLDAGYHSEVRSVADEHAPLDQRDPRYGRERFPENTGDESYLTFLKSRKSWAPELVARRAIANGKPVPEPIVELAEKIKGVLELDDREANHSTQRRPVDLEGEQ